MKLPNFPVLSVLRNSAEAHLSLERTASKALASALRPNVLVGVKSAKFPPGYPWLELSLGVTKKNVQEGVLKTAWLKLPPWEQFVQALHFICTGLGDLKRNKRFDEGTVPETTPYLLVYVCVCR